MSRRDLDIGKQHTILALAPMADVTDQRRLRNYRRVTANARWAKTVARRASKLCDFYGIRVLRRFMFKRAEKSSADS